MSRLPTLFRATPAAAERTLEFFTANIRNPNTRRAYAGAVAEFAAWCGVHGPQDLAALRPVHLAAYIEHLQGRLSAPTVKLHLAAVRGLFDWLVSARLCLSTRPARCAARGTPCAREKPLC